jgi:hypothetical protein
MQRSSSSDLMQFVIYRAFFSVSEYAGKIAVIFRNQPISFVHGLVAYAIGLEYFVVHSLFLLTGNLRRAIPPVC